MRTRILLLLCSIAHISACHKQEQSANLSDGELALQVRLDRYTEFATEPTASSSAPTASVWVRVEISGPSGRSGHESNVVLSAGESLFVVLPDESRQPVVPSSSLSPIGGTFVDYSAYLSGISLGAFTLDLVLRRADGRELYVNLPVPQVLDLVSPDLAAAVYNPEEPLTLTWESYGPPVTWIRLGGGGDCINVEVDVEPNASDYTIPAGISRTTDPCFDPKSTQLEFRQTSSARVNTDYFRNIDFELSDWTSFRLGLSS